MFPDISLSTDFAALGIQDSFRDDTVSPLETAGFAVRFDAASGAYIIDLPLISGKLTAGIENSTHWSGYIERVPGFSSYDVKVFKPSAANPILELHHTSFLDFWDYEYDDYQAAGFLAFGTPTSVAGIPKTGSATLDALVRGLTEEGNPVGGTATLQFDFGTGTLAGHFDPIVDPVGIPLGRYTFVNTVFGIGSTSFSGHFSHANPLLTGAFNGLFTGPNAEEFMAQWSAGSINPETQVALDMYGIWVGKRP